MLAIRPFGGRVGPVDDGDRLVSGSRRCEPNTGRDDPTGTDLAEPNDERLTSSTLFCSRLELRGENEESVDTSAVQGIFGTETELADRPLSRLELGISGRRMDVANHNVEFDSNPDPKTMPQTVRYLLGEGRELLAAKQAAQGVSEQPIATGYAGLYRSNWRLLLGSNNMPKLRFPWRPATPRTPT